MAEEAVGYIQAVAADLQRVRASIDRLEGRLEDLAKLVYSIQTGKLQALEIELATLRSGAIVQNENAIKKLAEGQMWLSRLVIGAVVTGLIGGGLAIVFRVMGHG